MENKIRIGDIEYNEKWILNAINEHNKIVSVIHNVKSYMNNKNELKSNIELDFLIRKIEQILDEYK